jgi:hypothetical protein
VAAFAGKPFRDVAMLVKYVHFTEKPIKDSHHQEFIRWFNSVNHIEPMA